LFKRTLQALHQAQPPPAEILEHAYTLAQGFWSLFHEPGELTLDTWLNQAETSAVLEFGRFAKSLRSDYRALKAAIHSTVEQ